MADSMLGSLAISLSAETAKFTDAISKAAYQLDRSMGQMAASTRQLEAALHKLDAAAGTFGVSLRSLFGIVAVGGMGVLVKGAIDSQAELGRLAERASTTVEDLNSMRVAAHEGGVSLEDVAISMNRLSKAVFEGQDGTTRAAQALGLLGLKAADLVKLPTAQAMQTVAIALNQFRDSAGKSAVEMELLAKSGTKAGAFLKAFAEEGPAAVSVTTQMATAAREAEAKFFALSDSFSTLQTAAANQLLPALNGILSAFVELQKSNDQSLGIWTLMGEGLRLLSGGLAQVYLLVKISIIDLTAYAAIANDIAHLRFGAVKDEWIELKKKINEAEEAQGRFYTALMKGSPFFGPPTANTGRSAMYVGDPYYHGSSPGGGRNIGSLPGTGRGSGAVDDPTRKILEAALAALKANSELEKAVLQNREQYLKAAFERGGLTLADFYSSKQAAQDEDLRRTSDNYVKEIALIDDFIAHAKSATEKAQGEKDKVAAAARQNLAVVQAAGRAQDILNEIPKATEDKARAAFETTYTGLSNQLERINLLQQSGAISELDALAKSGDAIRAKIGLLTAEADAYALVAKRSAEIDPQAAQEAQNKVDELRLRIDRLAVSAEAGGKKINDVFADSIGNALLDAIEGTKKWSDAFKSAEKSIVHGLNQIAMEQLKAQIFGKGGPASGIGGWLAALLSGSSSGGIGYGTAGSAIPEGPFPYASGTDSARGGLSLVGEHGPEIVNLPRGAQVIPNSRIRDRAAGHTIVNNINVLPGASRQTADQAAMALAAAMRESLRKYG